MEEVLSMQENEMGNNGITNGVSEENTDSGKTPVTPENITFPSDGSGNVYPAPDGFNTENGAEVHTLLMQHL